MPTMQVNVIKVPKNRLRPVCPDAVDQLATSIKDAGLIYPILVNNGTLVAGAHRLAALKKLGITEVVVKNVGDVLDPNTMSLIECDENLMRKELSASEKEFHQVTRVRLTTKGLVQEKLAPAMDAALKSGVLKGQVAKDVAKHIEVMIEDPAKLVDTPTPAKVERIIKSAEKSALAESLETNADLMGVSVDSLRRATRNVEAVADAGLDQDDLNTSAKPNTVR